MKLCLLAIALLNIQALSSCVYGDGEIEEGIDAGTNRTSDEVITLNEDGKPILLGSQINTSAASLTTPECENSWSLTASLNWGAVADWDFHLQTPNAHVFFGNRSADGFTLDHDANPVCSPSGPPPEVITGNGQCGTYKLFSNLFSTCGGSPPITFSATITALKPIVINGTVLRINQTFHPLDGVPFKVDPVSFEIAGRILTPPDDNAPNGEFASGSSRKKKCDQVKAEAARIAGESAAQFFDFIGATDAADLLRHFLAGTGTPVDYPDGTTLSQAVKADPQFIALNEEVQAAAAAQFNAGLLSAEVSPNLRRLDFSIDSTALSLRKAFGGTQGMEVQGSGNVQSGIYTGTITYTIQDIYGFTNKLKFEEIGKVMHYLQGTCGAPENPGGAHWFADSVKVTVPFSQPFPL